MARVVIKNLTKTFGGQKGATTRAVDRVSFEVRDREFLVLAGPSGCGKSTLLRLIAGLEESSDGTITIDECDMKAVAPKDRDIAMVFQGHALYPHQTAYENLAFGLTLRKIPKAEIDRRVRETAEMLGLNACLSRLPQELSGGERQRVAVGRALVRQPKLILFDEPFSNLDARLRAEMRRELAKLHQRLQTTMIYVTHDQSEAMTMGDRLAVMQAGAIEQIDAPLGVYQRPANLFVAEFIGLPGMNLFPGTLVSREGKQYFVEEATPSAGGASGFVLGLENAKIPGGFGDKRIIMGLRPEHFVPVLDSRNSNGEITVEAVIEAVQLLGPETHLFPVSAGGHSFVVRVSPDSALKTGDRVSLRIIYEKACFFDADNGRALI